jgi:hypothetical protein
MGLATYFFDKKIYLGIDKTKLMFQKINLKLSLLLVLIMQSFFANTQNYDGQFIVDLKDRVMKNKETDNEKWYAYKGQLGEGRTVYFLLNEYVFDPPKKEIVWGEYFYGKYHTAIKLEGKIKGGKIHLKETVKGKHTGTIIFDADKNNGLWMDNKGKEYPIELSTIDLRDYVQEYYADQSSRIKDVELRKLVQKYRTDIIIPTMTGVDIKKERIEDAIATKYLDENFVATKTEYDVMTIEYFHGEALFNEEYFILFSMEHSSPGAGGVIDDYLWMHTFSYEGKLISKKQLGCSCQDTDMGENAADHGSNVTALLDWDRLIVYRTYGSFYFESDEISRDSYVDYYKLGRNGKLIKQ